MAAVSDREWFDEKSLCAWLGIARVTAQTWRAKGEGPAFVRLGRAVRYRRQDVEAWLEAARVGGKAA